MWKTIKIYYKMIREREKIIRVLILRTPLDAADGRDGLNRIDRLAGLRQVPHLRAQRKQKSKKKKHLSLM